MKTVSGFDLNCLLENNISAISWRSVLLVEETGVPGEMLPHNVVSSALRHE